MSFGINVKGGTNAGWRIAREAVKWTCTCGIESRTYSCAKCGDRRPNG